MSLYPAMTPDVKWNPDEKIIGVVGVAPFATVDFYSKLIQMTPAQKDWEHVHVVVDSNPKIPSRGRYLELGETDPVPYIRQSIERLKSLGASVIAVPCNTAHILYERYTEGLTLITPNIIEVTVSAAVARYHGMPKSVAIFASRLTQQHRLYNKFFEKQGTCALLDVSAHQADISSLIEGVKQGKPIAMLIERMHTIMSHYKHADVFILGCTELSLLVKDEFNGAPVIDSNAALAEACLKYAKN